MTLDKKLLKQIVANTTPKQTVGQTVTGSRYIRRWTRVVYAGGSIYQAYEVPEGVQWRIVSAVQSNDIVGGPGNRWLTMYIRPNEFNATVFMVDVGMPAVTAVWTTVNYAPNVSTLYVVGSATQTFSIPDVTLGKGDEIVFDFNGALNGDTLTSFLVIEETDVV